MRALLPFLAGALMTFTAPPAWAADDEDLLEDDEDTPPDDDDLPETTVPTTPVPDDEDVQFEEPEEEEPEGPVGEGEDSATIYRDWQAKVADLAPDEEVLEWERYLEKYPNTAFRPRIEERMDTLLSGLYEEHIDTDGNGDEPIDADLEQLKLAQPLLLENINPRTRLQFGFEWGLPTWVNLYASYEYAFLRTLSVHGGVRHRYTGWSIEAGTTWSPIKSNRTGTILSLIGDVRFNAIPAFAGVRPQVGFGQIIADRVHLQAQIGADIELRKYSGVHLVGGANATFLLSPTVALFLEGGMDLKNLTWKEGNVFTFDTATFGIKFFPKIGKRGPGPLEANIGATIPFATWYWSYHYGSIMGQANYYFPER